jgi:nucleotide-binding universal stress UspA family protein
VSFINILVPVVFSQRCAWAGRYAARLAHEFGSQLIFLNVGPEGDTNTLDEFISREVGRVPHRSVVIDGDPAARIVECAGSYNADLIIMPTYHGRFRTFLIGSVTAKVLHDVDCPVLTGIHHYDDSQPVPEKFRNIVCALDDTPGCVTLYHLARQLAGNLGARLKLVHAIPAIDYASDNRGEVEVTRYLIAEAKKHFQAHFAALPEQPTVQFCAGTVATVTREAALSEHADLIAIGRGRSDRALGRLRTHTYSIIRNAPCPVISF